MALITPSALVTDIKGKVGGVCFQRSRGGIGVRAKIHPLNPRSVLQQKVRAYLAAAAAQWGVITVQERADWHAYSANTGWQNRLGGSIDIGGEAAFVRVGALRLLVGEPMVDAAPGAYGHAQSTVATITADSGTQTPIIAEPSAGFDGATSLTILVIFAAMPQPGSRDMAPNRFQYLQRLIGSSGNPVSFPFTLNTWPWSYVADQKITLGMVYIDANNRVSVRTFASCIAT